MKLSIGLVVIGPFQAYLHERRKYIMSNVSELKASLREKGGTGESRMHRRNNKVPGIIYGEKKEPLSINIDIKIFFRALFRYIF